MFELSCVYQDSRLIACDKPAGLLSVPGRVEKDCAFSRLAREYPGLRVIHRLDMATSGILLFALDGFTERAMHRQFREHRVHKQYTALVDGIPPTASGSIDLPLIADWHNRPKQKVCHKQGKPSLTRWQLLQSKGSISMLELTPVTGRSHQLRVHLAESAMPIIGDALYSQNGQARQQEGIRTMLHAHSLRFIHPQTGVQIAIACPLPEEMTSYWKESGD